MKLKNKVYNGRVESVQCPHWRAKLNSKTRRRAKDGFCKSRDLEVIGEFLPQDYEEIKLLKAARLLHLKCKDCGKTFWKLIEKEVAQDEDF